MEKLLLETSLPQIFFRESKSLTPLIGALSTMPVNKASMGLLNPMTSADGKHLSS